MNPEQNSLDLATIEANCTACKFFKIYDHKEPHQGLCRRYPPITTALKGGGSVVTWPLVDSDDYCGEFKPSH